MAVHTLYRLLSKEFFTDIFTSENLTGLRTGLKLQDFDFLFFTIDYEPNYLEALKIITQIGVEPLSSKRTRPILIAGGAAVSSNPFPLLPFFDLLCIGEAEVIIPEIVENFDNFDLETFKEKTWAIMENKKEGERVYLNNLNLSESFSAFYSPDSTFKMNLVELSRSCPSKCRFCLLSYNHLPPRWLPVQKYKEMIEQFPENSDIGLVGGSVLDHPQIREIINISQKFKIINPSSIKIDIKIIDVLEHLKKKGLNSVTIAPETGSEQLRKRINKKITNGEIIEFVKAIEALKFKNLKMYFMIGLPFETEEDIKETNNLIEQIRQHFTGKIELTFSIFVPKPHTPFQYEPFIEKEELNKRLRSLKIPEGVKVHIGNYKGALIQTIFSRGGEELGFAMLESLLTGKDILKIFDYKNLLFDERTVKSLPFNRIDSGVNQNFLLRELEKAQKGILTPYCNPEICKACGICEDFQNFRSSKKVE